MTFLFDDALEYCFALPSRLAGNRQEDHARGVSSKFRELERTLCQQKVVWSLNEDARAVAAICFATRRAAVLHVEQDFERVCDDLMRPPSLDVSDKTHATSIVLVVWVVETLF